MRKILKTGLVWGLTLVFCYGLTGLMNFDSAVVYAYPPEAGQADEEKCKDEDGTTVCLNMPFSTEEGADQIDIKGKNSFEIVQEYVSMIYKWGTTVTGLLAVLMLVVGGVQYMFYGVDPAQKDDAKERIQQSLLALVLLLMSSLILHTINPKFFAF